MKNKQCFIIQPFDGGVFDNRCKNIYKPAIKAAGLEPYRTDDDTTTRIPIEAIEKGIKESEVCFADISMSNPNVWYEIGFAFASGKDVVMVCEEESHKDFPFDIRHRTIIKYQQEISTSSDFSARITQQLKGFLSSKTLHSELKSTPLMSKDGLEPYEIAVLLFIFQGQILDSYTTVRDIREHMSQSGYQDVATALAIELLSKKDMIIINIVQNPYYDGDWRSGESGTVKMCELSEKGKNWVLTNKNQFNFKLEERVINDDISF